MKIGKMAPVKALVILLFFSSSERTRCLGNVSVNSNWVSKNLPGGSGFGFRTLPGEREFDKDRDFVANEIET